MPAPSHNEENPHGSSSELLSSARVARPRKLIHEDWLAIIVGIAILACGFIAAYNSSVPIADLAERMGKPGSWTWDPIKSFSNWHRLPAPMVIVSLVAITGALFFRRLTAGFLGGLVVVLVMTVVAFAMSGQETVKNLNLEYALWALLVGLVVSNTIGTPHWLRSAAMTEFFIKTGLVIFGAEILFGKLLALGLPGICVAWIVTPIVLITTFWFGQKVLKMESATLNMVISADMSVCGVSAAIATAAACKAKKEELSLAISLSLTFTVLMMVVLPAVCTMLGLSEHVGGAWLGGTIDSTGAVAAAGELLGDTAGQVAITIKMIQNILIGVVAFAVAWYWVRFQEPTEATASDGQVVTNAVGVSEIWRRFPKFVLGFLAASLFFSILAGTDNGLALSKSVQSLTKVVREWLFCMAFVSIGLDTNFVQLAQSMRSGKPLILYVCGQGLNLILTLAMAWLVFEKLFPIAQPIAN